MKLPAHGSSVDDVMARLRSMQTSDADYHSARTWGLIYNAGPEVDEMLHAAADHVLVENALNPFAFPSLREMQGQVVEIAADLLHGGDEVGGTMTSGGTESIFMGVKTARDRMREEKGIRHGRIILPRTAHPAFIKAAHLLDLEWTHMPLGDDLRTSAADLAGMITDDTVLAVGSAPAYPFGMIDPIPEMAKIASDAGVPFHVDACLGGFMLPFLERLGHTVPPWDFRVPGVSSISADVHKYGYAIKGASVILHRPKTNLRHQIFMFNDWPGGLYGTLAFLGTKPAPPIAACWAVLQFLGEEGYLRLAADTLEATRRLVEGVRDDRWRARMGRAGHDRGGGRVAHARHLRHRRRDERTWLALRPTGGAAVAPPDGQSAAQGRDRRVPVGPALCGRSPRREEHQGGDLRRRRQRRGGCDLAATPERALAGCKIVP